MASCDAIVIGGGINGLAAAAKLALGGARVTVIEAASHVGGMCEVSHLCHGLDERLEAALKLSDHGLSWLSTNLASTAVSATGNHLVLQGNFGETLLGDISSADRASWQALRATLLKNASLLAPFKTMTAPRLSRDHGAPLWSLLSQGLKIRSMGKDALREFMRLMLINVADVLDDDLTDDRLKGLLAFDTLLGHFAGPRSPNSLLSLYNRIAHSVAGHQAALALPRGGMRAIAKAMEAALKARGVTIRTDAAVKRINIDGDRARSVTLQSGEELKAQLVLSALHPQTTLMSLVGAPQLDTGHVRRTMNIRSRGTTSLLRLTLKDQPDFRGADLKTRLVIAPSVRAVEEAFNAVKYKTFSPEPVMECVVPTAFEPQVHHTLTALVQFAPHDLKGGWAQGKPAYLKAILAQLERHAPGIGKLVTEADLQTPDDIAFRFGSPGGQWHQAELSVEQMFFLRPAIGMAQYQTPFAGLYLASAAMHPGGGVTGTAGWNAATQALKMGGAA
ncbi:MAG: NAD(P)/FAD-dependent oxidoreductase [Hyphomicrobiales bacterium]